MLRVPRTGAGVVAPDVLKPLTCAGNAPGAAVTLKLALSQISVWLLSVLTRRTV